MALFDSQFLTRLEYLSLVSKRVFQGAILAQRRTKQLGGGIEFADHRAYTAGDDFRYLDWNLYARHGQLLLKQFQEEEDLHVYLLVDCSRSMAFGSPPKFDLARQVVGALAYIALADLDRVAVIAFGDSVVAEFPLARGKDRILGLLRFLEEQKPSVAGTDLARAAESFVHRKQRRGMSIVVSDFFDPGGFERGLDLLRYHRYETHVIQVYDQAEAEPTLAGEVELVDTETGLPRKVTITERNLQQYRQAFQRFQDTLDAYCGKYRVGCTRTSSRVPFDQLILTMMRDAGLLQ
jgi:uncharacterized protein (DUF58 family)